MNNIIQDIFTHCTKEYIDTCAPHFQKVKVLNHIISCRTPALGAALSKCECGKNNIAFHSCRDRHCPVCQGMNNKRWADKQMLSTLPIKYWHVVFTVPDSLNSIMMAHPKEAYDALFEASAKTVLKLSAEKKYLGATPGFSSVLHTWGQTMQYHPHIHMLLHAGGLTAKGDRFIDKSKSKFLFPFKVLTRLFRGIFIDLLSKNVDIDPKLKSLLYNTEFVCNLRDYVDGAGNVIKYLARYINRVCIDQKRVISFDQSSSMVTFSYKDNRDYGKEKTMRLSAFEFIRRFLLHILPRRFMKIRHYGILNNFNKLKRIELCRRLLGTIAPFSLPLFKFVPVCSKCKRTLPKPIHISAANLMHYIRLLC